MVRQQVQKRESGSALIEYAFLAALISVIGITGLNQISLEITRSFEIVALEVMAGGTTTNDE